MILKRTVSAAVRAYTLYAPTQRGATFLRRKTSRWLVARLDTGVWIRVSGVSDFEWHAFRGRPSPEALTMRVFVELLREGDTVLDIGANVGYYSLTAAARVGRTGRVIAVEADPRAARRLRENVALNKLENVTVIEAAASREAGMMAFHLGADSEGSSLADLHDGGEVVNVPVTTIDAIVAGADLQQVNILKMDVEGAEIDALAGASRVLSAAQPPRLVLEANPVTLRAAGRSVQDLRRCVESFGYRVSTIETLRWQGEAVENWLAAR